MIVLDKKKIIIVSLIILITLEITQLTIIDLNGKLGLIELIISNTFCIYLLTLHQGRYKDILQKEFVLKILLVLVLFCLCQKIFSFFLYVYSDSVIGLQSHMGVCQYLFSFFFATSFCGYGDGEDINKVEIANMISNSISAGIQSGPAVTAGLIGLNSVIKGKACTATAIKYMPFAAKLGLTFGVVHSTSDFLVSYHNRTGVWLHNNILEGLSNYNPPPFTQHEILFLDSLPKVDSNTLVPISILWSCSYDYGYMFDYCKIGDFNPIMYHLQVELQTHPFIIERVVFDLNTHYIEMNMDLFLFIINF
jgi:hypothetical protein